jgi:hypothetical protein
MINILIVSLITLMVLFAISYFILNKQFKKVSKDLKKLYIDNVVMQEYIDIIKSNENKDISNEEIDKENFIKFLSDSRDWAFQYIEEVQKVVNNFKTNVDPHINYFDKFGEVLSNQRPEYESMKTISNEYKILIKVLPG